MYLFTKLLNGPVNRPYYIESLDYNKNYAGIKVMHLLCHALNLIGEEAYVYTDIVNFKLRTPKLTNVIIENHKSAGREPIIVYPEVVYGNPRSGKSVVRYILNHPGLLGGPKEFHETDLIYFFSYEFSLDLNHLPKNILRVPLVDTALFNNDNNSFDKSRRGILIYPGRYHEGLQQFSDLVKRGTLITATWPASHKELSDLFRKSELIYCFTNSSIATEAMLCGCPVVLIRTPYTRDFIDTHKNLAAKGMELPTGIALEMSTDEVDRAKATVHKIYEKYQHIETTFWEQLHQFVNNTQAMPIQKFPQNVVDSSARTITISGTKISVLNKCLPNTHSDTVHSSYYHATYEKWLENHEPTEVDLKIIDERTANLAKLPNILILVVLESHEMDYLADTLDSFSQQIYQHWTLAILSQEICPDPTIDKMEMIYWLQVDDNPYQAINAILAQLNVFDWIAIIPAGSRLSAHALSLCANYIDRHSDWYFIYADEDFIDSGKKRFDPLFKPDFNLDLLRSYNYIGDFCLVNKQVIDRLQGYNQLAHVLNWDMCLKVFESLGEKAIGHIPEVLLHRPVRSLAKEEKDYLTVASKHVLQTHFERLGEKVAIGDGLVEDTFFIDYTILSQPLVSVVISIVDAEQLSRLSQCIESMRFNTQYANYEIIISSLLPEQEIRSLFDAKLNDLHLQFIPYIGDSVSPLSNRALHDVKGEFILLFSPDLLVLHSHWLEILIAQALRSDVGIVGARIIDHAKNVYHAGVLLGMGDLGVADYPHKGLPMDQPGYMKRAVVVQNMSAVSVLCLLVKKDLLKIALIADGNIFDHIDFCLQVRQQGYLIVWTPFVTLQLPRQVLQEKSPAELRQQADRVIANWLPQLANDPAYNRNLSLKHCHFQIETETDVTWNPDFHDRLRIFAFPGNDSGIGEYRVRAPLRALTNAAMIQSSLLPNHRDTLIPDIVEIERAKPDVLFLQNGFVDFLIHAWTQYRRFNNVFQIYSQDDLVFMLPQKHPLRSKWPKDIRKRLRKLLEQSDRLIVATDPLKEEFGKMIKDVRIVPNYLEKSRWLGLDVKRTQRSGKPRVGWAGAGQHQGDLELIAPVVEATAKEIDWIFFGMCPDALRPFIKEFHAGVPFDHYPAKLASLDLDLAIAPLEYNNFNMAKTNLRLLEYGIMGWPVVCSDILPYRNAPVTLVGNNPRFWLKAIREKIHEPEGLRHEGKVLQDWVIANYMLEDHLDEWLLALTPG